MPLRDHFPPPLDDAHTWEELHGQWPAVIVQQLRNNLPAGYVAAPRVHAGAQVESDVATFENDELPSPPPASESNGGAATAVWVLPPPSVAIETGLPDYDEYEVRIYDTKRGRQLVAAVEIVSPANKDRPEHRTAFVGKCAALLQKGVAVSIVDLVTVRHFNLYAELLTFIGQGDPTLGSDPPHLYAAACRWGKKGKRTLLEAWSHALVVGQPLPTLPLWLSEDLFVPLDLERSYEQACSDLWIA
jgi:hypothetical protein